MTESVDHGRMDYSTIPSTDIVLTGIFPKGIELSDVADRSARLAFSRSDAERVTHVLITLRRTLIQLEEIDSLDVELLDSNPTAGLVFERILWDLMEQAGEVNTVVAGAAGRTRPQSFDASCVAAREAGLLDQDLVDALTPDDGPYHVALQLCLDTEPGQAPAVIARALAAYQEYERRAAAWVEAAAG